MKFLRKLPFIVPNIQSDYVYKFWPIVKEGTSDVISTFCKDLLQNVVNILSTEDRVFRGPSLLNAIGKVSGVPANSYDAYSFKESEFHWLSLSNGYLEDESSYNIGLTRIIEKTGFPVISTFYPIIKALKNSNHGDLPRFFSPAVIRNYLKHNHDRWQDVIPRIPRNEVLQLFEYVLKDENFDELVGFKMIPLADGNLDTLTKSSDSYVYIGPEDHIVRHSNDELGTFKDQLNKFIDKSIDFGLYNQVYKIVKDGWNLNIKILDEFAVADMIRFSLSSNNGNSEEIQMSNHREWIYQLWKNFKYRDWDLTKFEDIHLIPTNRSTLRKLNTPKRIFSNRNISTDLKSIFERFGAVFVDNDFDEIARWDK